MAITANVGIAIWFQVLAVLLACLLVPRQDRSKLLLGGLYIVGAIDFWITVFVIAWHFINKYW